MAHRLCRDHKPTDPREREIYFHKGIKVSSHNLQFNLQAPQMRPQNMHREDGRLLLVQLCQHSNLLGSKSGQGLKNFLSSPRGLA